MNEKPMTIKYSIELYFDQDVKRWGIDGEVHYGDDQQMGISGSEDTLREAQRESLAALAFAFDSLREDGLLPADPAEERATASPKGNVGG